MGLFQRIFRTQEESRDEMVETVREARREVERAVTRLEIVVSEMLDENDYTSGRKKRNVPKPRT